MSLLRVNNVGKVIRSYVAECQYFTRRISILALKGSLALIAYRGGVNFE